ncbi:hypothetical protein [Vibrio harveyi]|uniref:hypothetical protein n=1 Tax=Vibrio harveyi TaxID=669 RepID=UPI0025B27F86|nr:hypothetical protein [Vibrio harveyi]WJT09543.1 hypothetical protein PH545_26425 [Vibrio harveyi]
MKVDTGILSQNLTITESFFLGAWFNMTHELSLDSERASFLHSINGCQELLVLLDFGEAYGGANKRYVVASELNNILNADPIVTKPVFNKLTKKMLSLTAPNDQGEGEAPVNKAPELVRSHLVEYVDKLQKHYIETVLDYLESLVFPEPPNDSHEHLEKILVVTESIISGLIASGSSINELHNYYRHLLTKFEGEEQFSDRYQHLKTVLLEESKEYEIELSVTNKELAERLAHGSSWTFGEMSLKRSTNNEKALNAVMKISARSRIAAGMKAHDKLGEILDALSFAIPNINLSIAKTFKSIDTSTQIEKQIRLHSPIPNHIHKMNNEELQRFIGSLDNSLTDTKLAGAYRQLRINTSTENIETRFVGNWTALEALTRDVPLKTHKPGDDEKVTLAAVPPIAIDYVIKRLRAYKVALSHINKTLFTLDNGEQFDIGDLTIVEMFSTLRCSEKSSKILQELNDFPFFKYRLGSFAKLCQDSLSLAKNIDKHAQKVSLQIKRLYRARNILVHDGGRVKNLELLCAYAEHYLKCNLNAITAVIASKPTVTNSQVALLRLADELEDVKLHLNPAIKALRKKQKKGNDPEKQYKDQNYNKTEELEALINLFVQ